MARLEAAVLGGRWWRLAGLLAAMVLFGVGSQDPRVRWGWDRVLGTVERGERWFLGRNFAAQSERAGWNRRRPLPTPMILGYYFGPAGDCSGYDSLASYRSVLSGIVPFWYTVEPDGEISGSKDSRVLSLARRQHLWVFALLQNMNGPQVYHELLENPLNRLRAMDNILNLVERDDYDGVNLDWEGIAPGDREAFSSFVADLGRLLHDYGYYLTLSVPAETADEPGNDWTGAYDYRALGRAVDLLMPMAYDEHFQGGDPGSIAAGSWVDQVLRFTVRTVPPAKVVLGIPTYGYDWGQGPARPLSYGQAVNLAAQYNHGNIQENHFDYVSDGQLHQVWFENTSSFSRKVSLVQDYEIRGIVLWRLGIEDPQIWPIIRG